MRRSVAKFYKLMSPSERAKLHAWMKTKKPQEIIAELAKKDKKKKN